jgi:ATP-dependent RNA helicase RhlE
LLGQRALTLSNLEIFTLDEADRMLDMGFVHDVRRICALLPAKRQTLLFSATMPNEIRKLADGLLRNPVKVEVTPVSSTVEKIEQSIYMVGKEGKPALLRHILADEAVKRVLVFTRTKHGADRLKRNLEQFSIPAEAIHGNKSQNHRVRSLASFKDGSTRVLVATDLASRGIDVDEITHIVNYDLPAEPETYVHRIGRTARAGHSGISFSFCGPEDRGTLHDIERLIRKRIQVVPTPHESEMKTPAPQSMPQRASEDDSQGGERERGEGQRNARGQRRGGHSEPRNNERRDSGHRRASTGHNQAARPQVNHENTGSVPAASAAPGRENRSQGQPRDSRPAHMRGNGNSNGQDSGNGGQAKRRNSQGQGKTYAREYYSNGR